MWTFGICYSSNQYLHQIISSIKNQNTLDNDQFEIILIGPSDINVTELYKKYKKKINIKHIMFEESIRAGWITLKKNLIVQLQKIKLKELYKKKIKTRMITKKNFVNGN